MALRYDIARLYVATFDRAADSEGLNYWDGTGTSDGLVSELTDINDISAAFAGSDEFASVYGDLSREDAIATMYENVFGRTADTAGLNYWVNSDITMDHMVAALLNGALGSDMTYVDNKAEVAMAFADAGLNNVGQAFSIMHDVDGTAASVAAAEAAINDAVGAGNTQMLTTGTDHLVGNAGDDIFDGSLGQNSTAGGVSNTLSSADTIDGGAGTDTLNAVIVPEFFGTTGDSQIDVQPTTTSVENVTFEARDINFSINGNSQYDEGQNILTVDAKDMTGVNKIGSLMSDGDLIIENLTTLSDTGAIRSTSDMTVTMDHTDSFDHDDDASDLTVLFDEDYLNTTTSSEGSSLTINMINTLNLAVADGSSLIEGFDTLTFSVGSDVITVDVQGAEISAVPGLIQAAVVAAGYNDITVSTYTEPAYFGTNIYYEQTGTTYNAGTFAGNYTGFKLVNSGPEDLTEGGFTFTDGTKDGSIAYSQDDNPSTQVTSPITINVELDKVGRDAEGGNLNIGAKGLNDNGSGHNTDVDKHDGINVFNVTVKGDEDRPSNLGTITSTNDALDTVNITSEVRDDDSYASLTVRGESAGVFGGTLSVLNANSFLGDLAIGVVSAAHDIDTFTATGGGDVTLNEVIGSTFDSFASLQDNAYSVTTGAGADTLSVSANSGAQLTVVSGTGDDDISVSINGADNSGSNPTTADISSADGNNTISVASADSLHEATITTGAGADTIYGNTVNTIVVSGAGNDTIYANNVAQKAIIQNTVADNTLVTDSVANPILVTSTTGAGAATDEQSLLYGRSVVVTLDTEGVGASENVQGFESVAVKIAASNDYLTTTADLHNAIATAINTDPVLSKLAEASVDSNGALTVHYLVDGVVDVDTNATIAYTISGDYADLSSVEQAGILAQLADDSNDSDLQASSLATAYDTANITAAQAILDNNTPGSQDGADSVSGDVNVINGGLGDDVIVLSSDDGSIDTVMIDANGFGNDTIVHFEVDTVQDGSVDGDVLDFAHLDNVTSLSGSSVSQIDVAGTVVAATAVTANSVVNVALGDLTDNDAGATNAMTFDTLTNGGVLNEINAAADFGVGALPANLVGQEVNSVFMVENPNDAGDYKVFEVVYNTDSSEFTQATLVGTLDFGDSVALVSDNIA